MRRSRSAAATASLLVLWLAVPARAIGGRREIHQECAVQTGCFLGDTPGFPVSIGTPGSYVLTSSLVVPALTSGIEVLNDGITIDLNGFTIAGPIVCTGAGTGLSCPFPPSPGRGIDAEDRNRITLYDGTVRGFEVGIWVGEIGGPGRAVIRNITVESNRLNGILLRSSSLVIDTTAVRNGSVGIAAGAGSVVRNSAASANASTGILAREGSSIVGSSTWNNGGRGFELSVGCLLRDSTAFDNGLAGVLATDGSLVSDVAVERNGTFGMEIGAGSSVQRSTARDNTSFGLFLVGSTSATYRENALNDNGPGNISGGVNMGANSCGGGPSCP